jgi:Xaa-Pro dipeptidase
VFLCRELVFLTIKMAVDEFNRRRQEFYKLVKDKIPSNSFVKFKGEKIVNRTWTDVELDFRQESYFLYLTGAVGEHNAELILNVASGEWTFLSHHISFDDQVWVGNFPADVEGLKIVSQKDFKFPNSSLIIEFSASDSNSSHSNIVKNALIQLRIQKSEYELDLMRKINHISSKCHEALMVASITQNFTNEHDYTCEWYANCAKNKVLKQAYLPIVAFGRNAAVLHYNKNNSEVSGNGLLLVDAGAEFNGYASDITRTWPVHGKFNPIQTQLYTIVLNAQKAIISDIKPGVEWEFLHRKATEIICQGLVDAGVVKLNGEKLTDVCWKYHVPQLFFCHGLGHLIGLDVHDVGGYPEGVERIKEPAIRYLRMRRKLEKGMVVTVEPGCYFIPQLLESATPEQLKFMDKDRLDAFSKEGGVRIEDCIVVTENGHENLTTAVKEISDIESLMAKK